MSAPYALIRSAFATALNTYPSVPSIAWENRPFTPTAGAIYLRPYLLPAEPYQAEIGANGINRHEGIYQISIFAPAGNGTLTLETLRDGLCNYFKRGTVLAYGGQRVTIAKAYPGPMLTETDWVQIPITIRYRADALN